jgi:hypothetical protein
MTISQILQNEGLVLIRPRKEKKEKGESWEYDVKEAFTGKKKGWVYLDAFTKSALRAVLNGLNDENKAKIDRLHITTLINFAWKHVE